MWRSMGYQNSGNRSCPSHSGNYNGDNYGNNKEIQKMWDKISQMFLIGSLSGIAVLGDVIREYLPVNLILTFGFINVGIMLLKMYFQKKFEEKSLYADNHYD